MHGRKGQWERGGEEGQKSVAGASTTTIQKPDTSGDQRESLEWLLPSIDPLELGYALD